MDGVHGCNRPSGELLGAGLGWYTPPELIPPRSDVLWARGLAAERRARASHLGALPWWRRGWYWLTGVPVRLQPAVRR